MENEKSKEAETEGTEKEPGTVTTESGEPVKTNPEADPRDSEQFKDR